MQNQNNNVENNGNASSKTQSPLYIIIKTTIILAAITLATALLLSFLNSMTKPIIEERQLAEKTAAIKELFADYGTIDVYMGELQQPVSELLIVSDKEGRFIGYCITTSPKGFGGKINMLVAVTQLDSTESGVKINKVSGIKILTMSETSGIGTKAAESEYLSKYTGKTKGIQANSGENSIDTITGATISSKAILSGVNAALDCASNISISGGPNE